MVTNGLDKLANSHSEQGNIIKFYNIDQGSILMSLYNLFFSVVLPGFGLVFTTWSTQCKA